MSQARSLESNTTGSAINTATGAILLVLVVVVAVVAAKEEGEYDGFDNRFDNQSNHDDKNSKDKRQESSTGEDSSFKAKGDHRVDGGDKINSHHGQQ